MGIFAEKKKSPKSVDTELEKEGVSTIDKTSVSEGSSKKTLKVLGKDEFSLFRKFCIKDGKVIKGIYSDDSIDEIKKNPEEYKYYVDTVSLRFEKKKAEDTVQGKHVDDINLSDDELENILEKATPDSLKLKIGLGFSKMKSGVKGFFRSFSKSKQSGIHTIGEPNIYKPQIFKSTEEKLADKGVDPKSVPSWLLESNEFKEIVNNCDKHGVISKNKIILLGVDKLENVKDNLDYYKCYLRDGCVHFELMGDSIEEMYEEHSATEDIHLGNLCEILGSRRDIENNAKNEKGIKSWFNVKFRSAKRSVKESMTKAGNTVVPVVLKNIMSRDEYDKIKDNENLTKELFAYLKDCASEFLKGSAVELKEAAKVVSGVDLSKDGNKGKSESVDKPSEAVEKKDDVAESSKEDKVGQTAVTKYEMIQRMIEDKDILDFVKRNESKSLGKSKNLKKGSVLSLGKIKLDKLVESPEHYGFTFVDGKVVFYNSLISDEAKKTLRPIEMNQMSIGDFMEVVSKAKKGSIRVAQLKEGVAQPPKLDSKIDSASDESSAIPV